MVRLPEYATLWQLWFRLALRLALALFVLNGALGLALAWSGGADAVFAPGTILFSLHDPGAGLAAWRSASAGVLVGLGVGTLAALALVVFLRLGASCAMLLAVGLIWGTLASTGADLWGDLAGGRPVLLVVVVVCWGVVLLLGAIRWGELLRVQDLHIPLAGLVRLTLIGHFFNTSLPGAVSGDLLKIAYVSDHSGNRQTEAVLTIFLDRIFGLLGLCIVASVMVLWNLPMLVELGREHRTLQLAAYTVGLGSVGGMVFVVLLELRERLVRLRPVALALDFGARHLSAKLVDIFRRLIQAMELYRGRRAATAKALLLAVAAHSLLGLGLYVAGRGIRESGLRPRDYLLTAQVANTVAAIPLTPGGVGTRDVVAKEYFLALGAAPVEKVGSIPIIMTMVMVGWGLVGAVVFVLYPRRRREPASPGETTGPESAEATEDP